MLGRYTAVNNDKRSTLPAHSDKRGGRRWRRSRIFRFPRLLFGDLRYSRKTEHQHLVNVHFMYGATRHRIPVINPLAPNDIYICRTAQLTSRNCILNIYSKYILTEYFKHAAHSPFFSRCRLFHNAIFFGFRNIHILNIGCAKILKKIPAPKG